MNTIFRQQRKGTPCFPETEPVEITTGVLRGKAKGVSLFCMTEGAFPMSAFLPTFCAGKQWVARAATERKRINNLLRLKTLFYIKNLKVICFSKPYAGGFPVVLRCRVGRCFAYAKVSTGHPHPRTPSDHKFIRFCSFAVNTISQYKKLHSARAATERRKNN